MVNFPAHIRDDGSIQSCNDHCKNVANITESYLKDIGLENTGYLVGCLHDAGKFTDDFCAYISKASEGVKVVRGSVIHTFAAVRFLLSKPHQSGTYEAITTELASYAIGSHHGLFDCFAPDETSGMEHRIGKQPEYDDQAMKNFFSECMSEKETEDRLGIAVKETEAIINKIRGICTSNSEAHFHFALATRMILSALIDADRTDTAMFLNPYNDFTNICASKDTWKMCLNNLETKLSEFEIKTDIQIARTELSELCKKASDIPTGIYRLNLPTGGGKTLSGLRFALAHAEKKDKRRIIFLAPLLSIIDQNATVIRKAIDDDSIILEHHSDVIAENRSTEDLAEYEFLTENWNSPIIITTLVQFLNTLFSGKTSSIRRFHSLINSVIVIDEVQTVPNKMLSLFNLAMNFLSKMCGATIILCSATQPEFGALPHSMRVDGEIISPEILKNFAPIFKRNQISYKGTYDIPEMPSLIEELFNKYKSVLVICNKKDQASSLFELSHNIDAQSYHLSAGMCMAHRKSVLEKMISDLNGRKKVLCVSTQVIEAGVDISFDAVIRFSAGIDNIVQAAGRCNRNGLNDKDAPVWIVDCNGENLNNLGDIKDAKNATSALLTAFNKDCAQLDSDLASAKAVSYYYKNLYLNKNADFFDFTEKNYPSVYSMLSTNTDFVGKDGNKYFMRQAFKTAGEIFKVFDCEQKSVLVPWGAGSDVICEIAKAGQYISKELLDKAKPFTVSLFSYHFDWLEKCGALMSFCEGEIYTLNKDFYDENIGVINKKKGEDICDTLMW